MKMKLSVKEIVLFGMYGALMYVLKLMMQVLPNIHLLGVFIVALTVVYRVKALLPLYTYVMLEGVFSGFAPWWVPYLYIWAMLWGAAMLLPKNMPIAVKPIVYAVVCSLHGFLFGIFYAPAQALLFGLDFNGMIGWIIYGIPADITHGVSNLIGGALICPLIVLMRRAEKAAR